VTSGKPSRVQPWRETLEISRSYCTVRAARPSEGMAIQAVSCGREQRGRGRQCRGDDNRSRTEGEPAHAEYPGMPVPAIAGLTCRKTGPRLAQARNENGTTIESKSFGAYTRMAAAVAGWQDDGG
jgi:hypothetical protein